MKNTRRTVRQQKQLGKAHHPCRDAKRPHPLTHHPARLVHQAPRTLCNTYTSACQESHSHCDLWEVVCLLKGYTGLSFWMPVTFHQYGTIHKPTPLSRKLGLAAGLRQTVVEKGSSALFRVISSSHSVKAIPNTCCIPFRASRSSLWFPITKYCSCQSRQLFPISLAINFRYSLQKIRPWCTL